MARLALLLLLAAHAAAWRVPLPLRRAAERLAGTAAAACGAPDAAPRAPPPWQRSDTLLNVHIVAHTHDDVGWCAALRQGRPCRHTTPRPCALVRRY
jgi:hypothetical protein